MSKVTAVIDIGSNSARMAVFRRTSRFGFSLIFEAKSKVRISEGCYENGGVLQIAPMERALLAVAEFANIAKAHKARKVFCVATSAVRDAPNAREFIAAVKKATKVQIKVIDGQKEAFYGAVACANLLHKKSGITIDIGGGSTECAVIEEGQITSLISLNLGTIRLKELFFDAKSDLKKAKIFVQNELDKIPQNFEHSVVFGIGGTIRALAKLIMKKEKYQLDSLHGFEFDAALHAPFFKAIYSADVKRLKDFGVPQDREDNIRGGALIFAALLEKFGTQNVVTSGVGVREGIFLSDLLRNQRHRFPLGFNPSYRSLLDRFSLDENATCGVKKCAKSLFSLLSPRHNVDPSYLPCLEVAAGLVKIGDYLSFYDSHEHSAYFVLHALSYGYSHAERAIISLLLQYSDKKIPKDCDIAHLSAAMPDIAALQWLSYLLSLAEILSDCDAEFRLEGEVLRIFGASYLTKERILGLQCPEILEISFA